MNHTEFARQSVKIKSQKCGAAFNCIEHRIVNIPELAGSVRMGRL
jgi:hypothetical protein